MVFVFLWAWVKVAWTLVVPVEANIWFLFLLFCGGSLDTLSRWPFTRVFCCFVFDGATVGASLYVWSEALTELGGINV